VHDAHTSHITLPGVGKQERPDGQRTRHPGYNRETSEVKWKDMKSVKENGSLKVTWADVVRGTNRPTQQVPVKNRFEPIIYRTIRLRISVSRGLQLHFRCVKNSFQCSRLC